MKHLTLEIAVDCPFFASKAAGLADRFELCCDLHQEGWTASPELMSLFIEKVGGRTPIHALIRPAPVGSSAGLDLAGFHLDQEYLDRSIKQVELAGRLGLQGVVVGPCTPSGRVDLDATQALCSVAHEHQLEVGFHRAFDLLVDRHQALTELSQLGICRVLSSGSEGWEVHQTSIAERVRVLRSLSDLAASLPGHPVEVVACGGIRASNAMSFISATGHLHSSCRCNDCPDLLEAHAISEVVARERQPGAE